MYELKRNKNKTDSETSGSPSQQIKSDIKRSGKFCQILRLFQQTSASRIVNSRGHIRPQQNAFHATHTWLQLRCLNNHLAASQSIGFIQRRRTGYSRNGRRLVCRTR